MITDMCREMQTVIKYEHWENVEGMFRLESDTFPSLKTTEKKNDYYNEVFGGSPQYTKEEYKNLQNLAMDYGINPISEIDAPGHSLLFTKYVRNHLDEHRRRFRKLREISMQIKTGNCLR